MQQQPHFHSNITLFSGCQGDTYCCHFPVPCLCSGCKEQPQNMELSPPAAGVRGEDFPPKQRNWSSRLHFPTALHGSALTTAPACPIKNSPSHKGSSFPKNESSLPHFSHSKSPPPCSRCGTCLAHFLSLHLPLNLSTFCQVPSLRALSPQSTRSLPQPLHLNLSRGAGWRPPHTRGF